MRFNLALFIMLIIASAFVFSAWQEDVRVFVVDGNNRPIEGATIRITYQREQFPIYTGMSLDGDVTQQTNAQGYADFNLHNVVTNPTHELRHYFIDMSYSTLTNSVRINCALMGADCNPGQKIHTFKINTNRVTLNIKDQSGRAIEGALVTYGGNEYITGPTGRISINIPQNTQFVAVVDFGESKRTVRDSVAREDKNIDVIFDRFSVRYRIINDEGVALDAEVIVNDEIKQTDENGVVIFEGITGTQIEVFVRFDEGSREFTYTINQDIDRVLVMDMTPPTITNVFHQIDKDKNIIFVNAKVFDPNPHGTGLRSISPVRMRYKIGDAGWRTVEMYTTGKDAFQATIPYENQLILYEIEASDSQENIERYNGRIEREGEDKPIENGENGEPIFIEPPTGGFINTTTLIIGGVIILIIAFIGYKFYTGEL